MLRALHKRRRKHLFSYRGPYQHKLRKYSDDKELICPYCREKVIFVDATERIKHFRHEAESDCAFEPETPRHIEMKQIILDKLNLDIDSLEVPLGFGVPDILDKENRIAIEVQHSALSKEKFIERTQNYTKRNIYPLWIFDEKLVNKYIKIEQHNHTLIRVPSFLKKAHQLYFGRIYTLPTNINDIYPVHFKPIKRWMREYENDYTGDIHGGYYKYYKKIKEFILGDPIYNLDFLKVENNGAKIARFYDKKFWDGTARRVLHHTQGGNEWYEFKN